MPSIVRERSLWVKIWANLVEIIEEVFDVGMICAKCGRTMTLLKTRHAGGSGDIAGRVAQLVEHRPFKPQVQGSSPCSPIFPLLQLTRPDGSCICDRHACARG